MDGQEGRAVGVEPFFVPSWPLWEVVTVGVANAAATTTNYYYYY